MLKRTDYRYRLTAVCIICTFLLAFLPQAASAASLKTVYVVSKISEKAANSHNTQSFTYDANGKVKSFSGSFYIAKTTDNSGDKGTFSYTGNHVSNAYFNYYTGYHTYNYFFTWKKNKVTKGTCYSSSNTVEYKYTYKNGKIVKAAGTSNGYTTDHLFAYDKKGRLISTSTRSDGQPDKTFSYDKKGNLKKAAASYQTLQYKTTYSKGRPVKIVCTDPDNALINKTYTIKYKKIKVTSAAKKVVDKQQKQLLFTYAYGQEQSVMFIPLGAM